MIRQGFHIGNRAWWLMVYYNVGGRDLREVYEALLACGCPDYKAQQACMVLSRPNTGYTFSNLAEQVTVSFISRATSAEQMYDSIQHELKHIVEHVSDYYGVEPRSEESAYLQGEIARKMFPAAAMVVCPVCNHDVTDM